MNFAKFLKIPFLTEHLQWLLLYITLQSDCSTKDAPLNFNIYIIFENIRNEEIVFYIALGTVHQAILIGMKKIKKKQTNKTKSETKMYFKSQQVPLVIIF